MRLRHDAISVTLVKRGPVRGRCYRQRAGTGPFLALTAMATGKFPSIILQFLALAAMFSGKFLTWDLPHVCPVGLPAAGAL